MSPLQPHIKLEKVDKICFVSGNPDRARVIASQLANSEKLSDYRGLVSYHGETPKNNTPITVLTTGMGGPTTAIVIEEAYKAGARYIIRIGSCGSLQSGDPMGQIYVPFAAIRDEGTSNQLVPIEFPSVSDPELFQILKKSGISMGHDIKTGLVWSTDIYYQKDPNYFEKWAELGATCVEMESSILFALQGIRDGLRCATILTSDGNLKDKTIKYSGDVDKNYKIFDSAVNDMVSIVINGIEENADYFS